MPTFKRGFKAWTQNKSLNFRTELNLKYMDPLCPLTLAEHLKVTVLKHNEIRGLNENQIVALNKEWSALTIINKNDEPVILYNSTHTIGRRNSDIMHELSHIICGHSMSGIIEHQNLPSTIRFYDQTQEDEANWLGGVLLVPDNAIMWSLYRNMSIEQIAQYFNVTTSMTNLRINMSGAMKRLKKTHITQ